MEAQTVWRVWRRILQEDEFQEHLFTASSDTLATRFGLNEEELEIVKAYAATPQRTQWFITNYRFRLTNSFVNALDTGAPLTLRALLAQDLPIKALAQRFLDEVGWHDYGPNVLTFCAAALAFLKEDVVTTKPEGLRDLIDLEAASVSLIQRLASDSTTSQSILAIGKDQVSLNGKGVVVTTFHTLTPWLKDKSLLGRGDLEPIPQHFLIYLSAMDEAYKLAGLSQRGAQLLNILTKPMTRNELNNKLKVAGFPLFQPEDNLIIHRFISYGVILTGTNFPFDL
jgi:hypothetical protein